MVRVLNVAEKNDAAKSLANVLSQGRCRKREGFSKFNKIYEFEYRLMNQQVTMTMTSVSGHLLGLDFAGAFKKWHSCNPVDLFSVPVEKYCPPNYVDIKRTLENEVRGCQSLIIWTDCDREGENIGFEIIQVCQAVKPNIKVYRAKFSEITPQAVSRAVNNLIAPDERVNAAVDVRQELDLRIGASFTRFQTVRLQKIFPEALAEQLVSYGSCQFPTLGFVVERYKQVQQFIPEPFWKLRVTHQHDDVKAEFSWMRNRLFNFLACQVLYDQCVENPLATVVDVKSKSKSKWRPAALDTVELEKLSSRKLKINAKETMKIAEKLYTQGFISYPRTETNMFPKDMDLVSLVEEQTRDPDWGGFAQNVLNNGPNPRNGTKTDQAHPPIHPLKYTDNLQGNERKVYEFIVRHFLACVSQDAQGHETVVEIDIAEEKFSAQGLMILARNYLEVYPYEKWNAKEIPLYRQGDQFEPNSVEIIAGETSAPPLLTEADLIALMEKHGIGTDATHADHIETVKSRMYVGLRPDGRFVPGHLGMGLVEGYDSMGYEMSKPNLRAELEADLKLICEGRKTKEEVLSMQIQKYKEVFIEACRQAQKLDEALSQYLGQAQSLPDNGGQTDNYPSVVMICPKCKSPMTLRTKKDGKGFYIGCSGYPNCKACIWLPDFVLQVHATDEICHVCQPGPVKKLQFTFRPGHVPVSIPNVYTGCVAGCDEMLNETLGIRPLSGQGHGAAISRTEMTDISPRNGSAGRGSTSSSSTTSNRDGGGQSAGANSVGVNSTRSFHTAVADAGNHHRGFQGGIRPTFNHHSGLQGTIRPTFNPQQNDAPSGNRNIQPNVSVQSFNGRATPQPSQFPRNSNSVINRPPLTSINSGLHNGQCSTFASPSVERSGGTSGSGKDIVCGCGTDALLLTVRKEGPNTGRQFYKCSGQSGTSCNFFLWADESEPQQRTPSSTRDTSSRNSFLQPQPQHRPAGGQPAVGGADEVQCRCGLPAKFLTVQKQGPNNGRQFYGCSKPREQSCQFFQWADATSGGGNQMFPERTATNGLGRAPFQPQIGTVVKRRRPAASESEGGPKQRKAPTCGLCGQPGHRKPKCPERSERF
ncbi:hypothetical protein BsWGS_06828 [Bradybaena similaris]